jgi:hypothetical protein
LDALKRNFLGRRSARPAEGSAPENREERGLCLQIIPRRQYGLDLVDIHGDRILGRSARGSLSKKSATVIEHRD